MNYLPKNTLVNGAIYEGYDDQDQPHLAIWNAARDRFLIEHITWEESYEVPLMHPVDEHEYFGTFYPMLRRSLEL